MLETVPQKLKLNSLKAGQGGCFGCDRGCGCGCGCLCGCGGGGGGGGGAGVAVAVAVAAAATAAATAAARAATAARAVVKEVQDQVDELCSPLAQTTVWQ